MWGQWKVPSICISSTKRYSEDRKVFKEIMDGISLNLEEVIKQIFIGIKLNKSKDIWHVKITFRTRYTELWNQPNRRNVLAIRKYLLPYEPIYLLKVWSPDWMVLKTRSENSIFSLWLGYPLGNRRERVLSNKAKHRNLVLSNLIMKKNCNGAPEAISMSY